MIDPKQIEKYEKQYETFRRAYEKQRQRYQELGSKQGNFIERAINGAEQCSVSCGYIQKHSDKIFEILQGLGQIYVSLKPEPGQVRDLASVLVRYGKRLEKEVPEMMEYYRNLDAPEEQKNKEQLDETEESIKGLEQTVAESAELLEQIMMRARVGRLMADYEAILDVTK
jgi:hypothetical protein